MKYEASWCRAAMALTWGVLSVGAQAQDSSQVFGNPPSLDARYALTRATGGPTLSTKEPDGTASKGGATSAVDLRIQRTRGTLWNPATGRNDTVELRSYQGDRVDPNFPYISPALEVKPGSRLRIRLDNQLKYTPDPLIGDPGCVGLPPNHDHNVPHCFDGTNLHSHGLWISPDGNSDNVLINVVPGSRFEYEYNIPDDHPAGTYWYHTHRHGSTALQVSSGMAGALIVRGNRMPTATQNGDLDTLLKGITGQPFTERLLVMQQIQYACKNPDGSVKTNPDGTWLCEAGDVGTIDKYVGQLDNPAQWRSSGRYTSINGRMLPTFEGGIVGRVERWRVIHGGIRDTVTMQFRKLRAGAPPFPRASANQQAAYIDANCTGEPLVQHLVASDGLTLPAAIATDRTTFQPAYRWDMLMVFPEAGQYCMIDTEAPATGTVAQGSHTRQLMGLVKVSGLGVGVSNATISNYLALRLFAAAQLNMPLAMRGPVGQDLLNGLKLTRFVDHPTVEAAEITGNQTVEFNIAFDPLAGQVNFMVDGTPYDENSSRRLVLGDVEEWRLTSGAGGHPFHIHVNPFQIVAILDPNGKDVSASNAVDDASGQVDPQYRGLKGAWKDTIFVKSLPGLNQGDPARRYTVIMRTRYQRFIGTFVLHCHILDHEDQGMMQKVTIVLPGMRGAPVEQAAPAPLATPTVHSH